MSRLVQGLESDGFVVRRSAPDDRRAAILRASKRGTDVLRAGRAQRVQAFEALLERTTLADIQTLDRAARLIESSPWALAADAKLQEQYRLRDDKRDRQPMPATRRI